MSDYFPLPKTCVENYFGIPLEAREALCIYFAKPVLYDTLLA